VGCCAAASDHEQQGRPDQRASHDGNLAVGRRFRTVTTSSPFCASYLPTSELRLEEDMGQLFMHRRLHRHTGVRTYVLLQQLGIPYEIERTVCSECRRVLDERRLKRAAA